MKDDVFRNTKKKKKRKKSVIIKCFECDSTEFYTDDNLKEISCLKCGLVLVAPYSADFIVDGFKIERCLKMYRLTKEDLSESKKRLNYYNFDFDSDYSKYIFNLRFDSERILSYIENIPNYDYSAEDISLILDYMDYLKELIKISNKIIEDVYNTRKLKLSTTKKESINITLSIQRNLFSSYDSLFKEMINLLKLE